MLDRTLHRLAYIERTVAGMVAPPANKRLIVGCTVAHLPIELWQIVIHPSLTHPLEHIGIEVIVVLQSVGGTSIRVGALVAIDAKGRNAELHPRFHLAQVVAHLLDKEVDILTSPVATVHSIAIPCIRSVIGNGNTRSGIGIEIVIYVNAIHIITAHNVARHLTDIVAVLGTAGVKEQQTVIIEETVGVTEVLMRVGQCRCTLCLGTIRVDPCMQLHLSGMTLLYHPLQGIPIRIGSQPLLTGQITTPRFQFTGIERIALTAYLKEDGIDAIALKVIELACQHLLHTLTTHSLKLPIHTLNPGTTKFPLRVSCQGHRCQQQKPNKHVLSHNGYKYTIILRHWPAQGPSTFCRRPKKRK